MSTTDRPTADRPRRKPMRKRDWARRVIFTLGVFVAVGLLLYRPDAGPDYRIEALGYGVCDAAFARSLGGVLGAPPIDGNEITILHNGDEIFAAMLDAIRRAEHTINFETYIYENGEIGARFVEACAERARAGVDVNIILDAVGAQLLDDTLADTIREAGVDLCRYEEPTIFRRDLLTRANCRTHRKLLIVDGQVGFLGGVGIGDAWRGDARGPDEWRDVHFRVRGPAVATLQSAFGENWLESTGELIHGEKHYPELAPRGTMRAVAVHSSPDGTSGAIQTMFLLAIAGARDSIRIATPYFVPDQRTLDHLVAARERGVAVDIVVAGPHTDAAVVRSASRHLWGDLLEAGVRLHEYQPTMFHCKYMIVDDEWTSIGSANFDNRSFKLNDEANLVVVDSAFGARLSETFDVDRAASTAVSLEAWSDRPWLVRVKESAAALLREYL